MKLTKILGWSVVVILILFAIGIFMVAQNINSLVKSAVEDVGSDVLKTAVTLESADIELFENRIQLSGLKVANPPGFTASNVFEMSNISIDIELASLLENLVNIHEVSVDGARITAEQMGVSTNLQTLMNNINNADTPADTQNVPNPKDEGSAPSEEMLVKVNLFSFSNGSMSVITDKWGEQETSIPTIELRNIGGNDGLPAEKLAPEILKPLLKQLNNVLKQRLEELLREKGREKLKEKEDELKVKLNEKLGGDSDQLKSLFSD